MRDHTVVESILPHFLLLSVFHQNQVGRNQSWCFSGPADWYSCDLLYPGDLFVEVTRTALAFLLSQGGFASSHSVIREPSQLTGIAGARSQLPLRRLELDGSR